LAPIKLVIFDVDGTLAEAYRLKLLSGVEDFFNLVLAGNCSESPRVALATNQGGVGMRCWMEKKGWKIHAGRLIGANPCLGCWWKR
jgi:phosphoglycolate phosphatase-like HAD superfamily hydrolase